METTPVEEEEAPAPAPEPEPVAEAPTLEPVAKPEPIADQKDDDYVAEEEEDDDDEEDEVESEEDEDEEVDEEKADGVAKVMAAATKKTAAKKKKGKAKETAGKEGIGDKAVEAAGRLLKHDPESGVDGWKKGEPVPYLFLANVFENISETTKRLEIAEMLTNAFRTVIVTNPERPTRRGVPREQHHRAAARGSRLGHRRRHAGEDPRRSHRPQGERHTG